jgi:hypothetical protein
VKNKEQRTMFLHPMVKPSRDFFLVIFFLIFMVKSFLQLQQQLIKLSTDKVWLNLDQSISNYQNSFGERSIQASVLKQSLQKSMYYIIYKSNLILKQYLIILSCTVSLKSSNILPSLDFSSF